MAQGAGASPLQQIGEGYGSVLRSLGHTLLFILIILGLSATITLPLWYFALHFTDLFTAVMLLLLGGLLLTALGRRLLHRLRAAERPARDRVKTAALRAARTVASAAFIYFLLVIASGPAPLAAVPYTIIGLLVLGYMFFVRRR